MQVKSVNKYIGYGCILFVFFVVLLVFPVMYELNPKLLHGELLLRFRIFAYTGAICFISSVFLNIYGLVKLEKNTESGWVLAVSILSFEVLLLVINLVDVLL